MARFNRGHSGKQMPVANYFHHDPKWTFLDSMMRLAPRSVTERDSGAAQFYERCGFSRFGQINDFPAGFARAFLYKKLPAS
jgi:hypothetical protein